MSTTTTVDLQAPDTGATEARTGIFRRLIAARMRQAEALARQHIARFPDQTLAELGLSPEQIATVRATGEFPADFWR